MEARRIVVEVIGWAGALVLLAAYGLLSSGTWPRRTSPSTWPTWWARRGSW